MGMLILGRRIGEKIMIGDDIIITILQSTNMHITRVGIEAPKHLAVHREEIWNKVQLEKEMVSSYISLI